VLVEKNAVAVAGAKTEKNVLADQTAHVVVDVKNKCIKTANAWAVFML